MKRLLSGELTGALIRAGRALANVSVKDLSEASGVGEITIKRAEAIRSEVSVREATAAAILAGFDRLGVMVIARSGNHGPGVVAGKSTNLND